MNITTFLECGRIRTVLRMKHHHKKKGLKQNKTELK